VTGISSVTLTNEPADEHSVYIWLFDGSTGQWNLQNGSNALAFQDSTTFNLQTGRGYTVRAIDPSWCGGKNDPENNLHPVVPPPGPCRGCEWPTLSESDHFIGAGCRGSVGA
jgi:hypothetical protein